MAALLTVALQIGCGSGAATTTPDDDASDAASATDATSPGTDAAADAATDVSGADTADVPDSADTPDAPDAQDTAVDTADASTPCECGDGNCNSTCGETLANCPMDCAMCGDAICSPGEGPSKCAIDCCGGCGDGLCKGYSCGENPTTCPNDCGTSCGNAVCDKGESPLTCPGDCIWQVCGNHVCEPEDGGPKLCPSDCGNACGNCVCDKGESWTDCPTDCGFCGDSVCSACPNLGETTATCASDCKSDVCAANQGAACDDGSACTTDVCDSKGNCFHIDSAKTCDDGLGCTNDACDPKTGCTHVADASPCSDGNPCTTDACDLTSGCTSTAASGATCDDANGCTQGDLCTNGSCAGTAKDCADSDPCTVDACSGTSGYCTHTAGNDGVTCDDGLACTQGDACQAGKCVPATSDCPCVYASDCDDGAKCTVDKCDSGTSKCVHTPIACNDNKPCTADACDPTSGQCVYTPDDNANPGTTSCFIADCQLGTPMCKAGAVTCQAAGADLSKDGSYCNGGEGTCKTGQCQQNFAPTILSAAFATTAIKAGTDDNLVVVVADDNSDSALGIDDIATVTVDLSQLGGAASVALTAGSTPAPNARSYALAVPTTAASAGTWLLPIVATDKAGKTAQALAAIHLVAGNVIAVGATQTYTTIDAAISAAASGDVILLDAGTYAGTGNKALNPLGKSVAIVGKDGAATTILDCQGAGRAFNFSNPGGTIDVTLAGLTIQNCAASAVRVVTATTDTAKITISGCIFATNNNGAEGGAITATGVGTTVNIAGTAFTSNTAKSGSTYYDGGALYASDAKFVIAGSTFAKNEGHYGAAVELVGQGAATLSDTTFTGHVTTQSVVYGDGQDTSLIVTRCAFVSEGVADKCLAGNNSGGTLTVKDSRFEGCKIGVIAFSAKPCSVDGCVFKNNLGAPSYYGAVNFCDVSNSLFSGNKQMVYSTTGNGNTIASSLFINNDCSKGSYVVYSNKGMTGCTFIGNKGVNVVETSANVTGCTFQDNVTTNGTLLAHGVATVNDCVFTGNTSGSGGAVNAYSGYGGTLSNLLIVGNTATSQGGGVRVGSGTWTLANLTVVGNTAPLGGGLYLEGGTATLHHAIVWGNFAVDAAGTPLGAQLYIANASASLPTVQFCDIANAANDVVDDGVKINGGDGFAAGQAANLSANPLFAQGPAGAYYLSQTAAGQTQPSPCVDPVNANALVAPLAAAAGFSTYTTRTDGIGDAGTLDLGWHYGP